MKLRRFANLVMAGDGADIGIGKRRKQPLKGLSHWQNGFVGIDKHTINSLARRVPEPVGSARAFPRLSCNYISNSLGHPGPFST